MQELVIKNAKSAEYTEVDLNKFFEPDKEHKRSFGYKRSIVCNPHASGEGKLSVCFYTLEPGQANYPYHYHAGSEEAFYIISGTGTLKTPTGDKAVSEGDVIVMPPNEGGAHMLINTSNAPLLYLDIDSVNLSCPEVAFYPESEKVMIMTGGIRESYKRDSTVNYLDGE